MADIDVGRQMRLIRLSLAGASMLVSEIEGALTGGFGETVPEEVPGLVWDLREKIGQAGALAAEWDMAINEGQIDNPTDEQEPEVDI